MKHTLLYTTIVLATLAVFIAEVNIIPYWQGVHYLVFCAMCLIVIITAVVYLIKHWRWIYRTKSAFKRVDWIKSITLSMVTICIPIMLYIHLGVFAQGMFQGWFLGPTLINEMELEGEKIYLYHSECSIFQNECECDDYHSLIYVENHYIPVMHLVKKIDFYVGEIQVKKGLLVAKASKRCPRDIGKEIEIEL